MRQEYMKTSAPNKRRQIVRDAVLELLRTYDGGVTLTTNDVTELLWPVAQATGEAITERRKFIDDLLRLARTELNGVCARQGPPDPHRKFMGRPLVPWLWFRPAEGIGGSDHEICPLCGR